MLVPVLLCTVAVPIDIYYNSAEDGFGMEWLGLQVEAVRFITTGSIEERMMELQVIVLPGELAYVTLLGISGEP